MRVLKIVAVLSIGLVLTLALTSQIAAAQVTEPPTTTAESAPPKPLVPFTYAWVITSNVPVYSNPGDAVPVRNLGTGFLYVSVSGQPIVQGDQTWYMINPGEYINASNIRFVRPSSFQGIPLDGTPDKPFGWMVYSVKPSPSAGATPAKDAKIINRYTTITVYETQKVGDLTWYRIGDNQWVDQKKVGLVFPTARPADVGPTDKWIDVNRFEQTLAAYEGDRMVYATLVSSGLPQWDTDLGLFHVYMKIKVAKMSGRDGKPDYYFLEDVPWAMYFNKDMALHGAYWHDKFGFKHSHGCVNLPLADAKWLWDWTAPYVGDSAFVVAPKDQPGTWVWVHD